MESILFFEKLLWFGFAAVGFAILFNVPLRTLWVIFIMGALAGTTKLFVLQAGGEIVLASFSGAIVVGIISIPAAHSKHAPPMVFAIPSVIPLVPGALAYRTMLGLIQLTGEIHNELYQQMLYETVNNGLKALFVLLSIAVGVSLPMIVLRRDTVKQMKIGLNK